MDNSARLGTCLALARDKGTLVAGVTPISLPGRGLGLVTTENVRRNTVLINVPEQAMVFGDRSFIRSHPALKDASPQAQLAAYLTYMQVHRSAEYQVYSACWPSPEDCQHMLLWWYLNSGSSAQLKSYIPHPLNRALEKAVSDWMEDSVHMAAVHPDLGKATEAEAARLNLYHWTIANTRSFSFDSNRGLKRQRVVMCPVLDFMNHCESDSTRLDGYAGNSVCRSDSGFKLIAARDYKQGEEILATYGAHDNDFLIAQYGFALDNNRDDNISLDEILLPAFNPHDQGVLRNVGYWADYSLKPVSGQICFRTQVAVRSKLIASKAWEHFIARGQDSGRDRSADVVAWLRPHVLGYLSTSKSTCEDLAKITFDTSTRPQDAEAAKIILNRRQDINQALEAWMQQQAST